MLVLMAVLLASAGDTAAVSPAPPDSKSQVLAADGEWRRALLSGDKPALEKLLAPAYSLTTAMGRTERAQWMDKAGVWKTLVLEWRAAPRVDVYGSTAIVSGTLRWKVLKDAPDPRTGSAEVDQDFLVTDVWIRQGDRWQVAARHSTVPLKPR